MTKKIILAGFALVLATSPFMHQVKADDGGWEPVAVAGATTHDTHVIRRLNFSRKTTGPFQFGEVVALAEPKDSCYAAVCNFYDVYFIKDGLQKKVEQVPGYALDVNLFAKNNNRFVFVRPTSKETLYDIVEFDLKKGEEVVLGKDIFINHPTNVGIMVNDNIFYLEVEYNFSNHKRDYKQAAIMVWSKGEKSLKPITKHWELRREELQDIQDGVALVKMVFESGHEELWLMDHKMRDYRLGQMRSIPGTWTEPHGDIQMAHFSQDGLVEYFQYYVRHTYDPVEGTEPVREGETLNWFKKPNDAYRIKDGVLTWLDDKNNALVSYGGAVAFASTEDKENLLSVGSDKNKVATENGFTYYRHNRGIYEAVPIPNVAVTRAVNRAVRSDANSTVYMVYDNVRYAFETEGVFLSWFDSWDDVEWLSEHEINKFPYAGMIGFAEGTRVKSDKDKKLYVVGRDGKLHWLASEKVAKDIYGQLWNKGVVQVPENKLFNYKHGSAIKAVHDVERI